MWWVSVEEIFQFCRKEFEVFDRCLRWGRHCYVEEGFLKEERKKRLSWFVFLFLSLRCLVLYQVTS